jgi:hypothetical protein
VYGELEYRNFTVHGKSKETEVYTENGVDNLNTPTSFRPDASYSVNHVNYVDQLIVLQITKLLTRPVLIVQSSDDISSYVGISGLGLTLGLKYSL